MCRSGFYNTRTHPIRYDSQSTPDPQKYLISTKSVHLHTVFCNNPWTGQTLVTPICDRGRKQFKNNFVGWNSISELLISINDPRYHSASETLKKVYTLANIRQHRRSCRYTVSVIISANQFVGWAPLINHQNQRTYFMHYVCKVCLTWGQN